jgi:hypothetical protein
MFGSTTRRLIAVGTAVAALAGGGAALAAGHSGTSGRHVGFRAIAGAVTSYLGLSEQQLHADLAAGQTLAQIATSQGKTVTGLEQTIEAAAKAKLDQAVTAGTITSQQEQAILSRRQARLSKFVTTAHPGGFAHHGIWRGHLITASASYIGINPDQLRAELKAGKTRAQVATEHGKTVAGLEQAITAAVKTRLDNAVSAGKITSAQEQKKLKRVAGHLDELVNRTPKH